MAPLAPSLLLVTALQEATGAGLPPVISLTHPHRLHRSLLTASNPSVYPVWEVWDLVLRGPKTLAWTNRMAAAYFLMSLSLASARCVVTFNNAVLQM